MERPVVGAIRRGILDPLTEDDLRRPRSSRFEDAEARCNSNLNMQLQNARRGSARGPARSRFSASVLLLSVIVAVLAFSAAGPAQAQRTNFCERVQAVSNGSLAIRDALTGLNPSVAIYKGSLPTYFSVGPNGRPVSGFLYNLLQRVAAEGSFQWAYELTADPDSTDDIYLADITKDYDTVAKVSFDTALRRQKGLDFSPPLLDASIVLITDRFAVVSDPHTDWLVFMAPFSWDLWVAILVLIIVHALGQMYIDYVEILRHKSDGPDPPPTFERWEFYFYISTNTYHWRRHESAKRSGRALYTIYIFVFFVLFFAYCGNLTSSLILLNASTIRIANIEDANRLRASLCFRNGAAAISLVTSVYPNVQVVPSVNASNQEVLDMLAAGKCEGAILAYNDWQIVGQSTTNLQCNLIQTGPLVRQMSVSIPFTNDFSGFCTSLFGNTVSNIIQNLTDTFVVQSLWSHAVSDEKQTDCSVVKLANNISNTKLTFNFMQGLFWTFLITMGICMLGHLFASAFDWHTIRSSMFPKRFSLPDPSSQRSPGYGHPAGLDDGNKTSKSMAVSNPDNIIDTFEATGADLKAPQYADVVNMNMSELLAAGKSGHKSSPEVAEARRRALDAFKELMKTMENEE